MPHQIQIHGPCATFQRCRCLCAIKQCQCSMSKMSIKEKKKRNQRQPHGSALLSHPHTHTTFYFAFRGLVLFFHMDFHSNIGLFYSLCSFIIAYLSELLFFGFYCCDVCGWTTSRTLVVDSLCSRVIDGAACWKRDFVVSSYVDLRSSTLPVTSARSLSGGAMMIAAVFTRVQT